jgi:hypothetical protein
VRRQFAVKPGNPFQSQVVAQELYGVSVRQIQLGIGVEALQPGLQSLCSSTPSSSVGAPR